ncbi:MAG: hypothetical protein HN742_19125 [Lentisphaerae bacterium]|jgi:hypothetical protein|nr:hypothetical protein [Lentisphaerota bacterium]MBT4817264.1 hypothetical protein [Lentisphaerota bacterium]MBT5607804.1 hypothetical protein [Lentisphaerota bacterium]MBT7061476.1 hypothetical protein [Lentisphaerota bacterium]MBT7844000.1 hypothetical protein [Lentisphaerota bacterium]
MIRITLVGSVVCAIVLASTGVIAKEDTPVSVVSLPDHTWCLSNAFISRTLSVSDGRLRTVVIGNRLTGMTAKPGDCNEFELRISQGTHTTGTDRVLTAASFRFVRQSEFALPGGVPGRGLSFLLENDECGLSVEVHYELRQEDFYLRKHLVIVARRELTLERINVESLALTGGHQPYTVRAINARGKWSPGLGQPLHGIRTATFWGVEFPASVNVVQDGVLRCGYLWGRQPRMGSPYRTYSSVVGVAGDPAFVTEAFYDYIDRVRIRPFRLQVQYNTWFDTGRGVTRDSLRKSIKLIHRKLVAERGNSPLSAYVIDDGWQDTGADWTDKTWKVNGKFDADFASSLRAVREADSSLGLWLSPGCLFGASRMVARYRAAGFEALDDWMSLAGPRYMQLLEDRMVELTRMGTRYFKLDGLFGHLNLRNFELRGDRYGIPYMPQLGLEGVQAGDKRLNAAAYDELKIYYLTAGTERLMKIFGRMAEADSEVYIVISNGAYLSAWWLQYVDAVWMINAGDAAGGSSRTEELVYRDERYHEIWQREHTQYPMHAIFNHEPKKRSTGEPKEVFRKYLYMNLSRGTGFIELYIKPAVLGDYDWDVISEGLHWVDHVFPTFKRSRMHGGNPKKGEVYGYTAWTESRGYISLHNPAGTAARYRIVLDKAFGLGPDTGPFALSSPMADSLIGLGERYDYGDTIELELKPREIRVLNFDTTMPDWSILKALQIRTEDPPPPKPVELVPVTDHAILGIWDYAHGGKPYSREFTSEGVCVLRQGKNEIWRKPFAVRNAASARVAGRFDHVIKESGVLRIESRYTARRRSK